MKQLETITEITIRWWRSDGDIISGHVKVLEESGRDHALEMMKDGFTSGDLNDTIKITDEDPEDGVEYQGWWEITIRHPDES